MQLTSLNMHIAGLSRCRRDPGVMSVEQAHAAMQLHLDCTVQTCKVRRRPGHPGGGRTGRARRARAAMTGHVRSSVQMKPTSYERLVHRLLWLALDAHRTKASRPGVYRGRPPPR